MSPLFDSREPLCVLGCAAAPKDAMRIKRQLPEALAAVCRMDRSRFIMDSIFRLESMLLPKEDLYTCQRISRQTGQVLARCLIPIYLRTEANDSPVDALETPLTSEGIPGGILGLSMLRAFAARGLVTASHDDLEALMSIQAVPADTADEGVLDDTIRAIALDVEPLVRVGVTFCELQEPRGEDCGYQLDSMGGSLVTEAEEGAIMNRWLRRVGETSPSTTKS
jgi:hypothetical protein